jgi:hypothetical protein
MVAAIGNHEVDGGYNMPRVRAPFFFALFDGLFRETSYAALDFGDYLSLVLLDSGHTSPIGGAQADWLEKTLKARAGHPNVIAVNHVPAYPSHRNPEGQNGKDGTGEGNRKHWVPLFEKYGVPVVLEHHDHTFKRTKPLLGGLAHDNGILYLGDGSWGRLRTPHTPEERPYLAVSSRDYQLSLHRIQGDERFHMALDENGRIMDVLVALIEGVGRIVAIRTIAREIRRVVSVNRCVQPVLLVVVIHGVLRVLERIGGELVRVLKPVVVLVRFPLVHGDVLAFLNVLIGNLIVLTLCPGRLFGYRNPNRYQHRRNRGLPHLYAPFSTR